MKEPKYAVIFPFLKEHIERVFAGRDVVCKYVGKRVPRFTVGSKLLFYASGGGSELRGVGTIETMEFLGPEEIVRRYHDKLFISPSELDAYRGDRSPDRELLAIQLSKVRRFSKPIRMQHSITMAGQTLTREEYRGLVGH